MKKIALLSLAMLFNFEFAADQSPKQNHANELGFIAAYTKLHRHFTTNYAEPDLVLLDDKEMDFFTPTLDDLKNKSVGEILKSGRVLHMIRMAKRGAKATERLLYHMGKRSDLVEDIFRKNEFVLTPFMHTFTKQYLKNRAESMKATVDDPVDKMVANLGSDPKRLQELESTVVTLQQKNKTLEDLIALQTKSSSSSDQSSLQPFIQNPAKPTEVDSDSQHADTSRGSDLIQIADTTSSSEKIKAESDKSLSALSAAPSSPAQPN